MRASAILFLMVAATTIGQNAQQPAGSIDPPDSARLISTMKGDGVQIYACADSPTGVKWVLKGPDAKLLDADGKVIGSHSAGPTWKLIDGGLVQGELMANQPSPDAGSIPWLLLRAKAGTAAGSLSSVAFIRRAETHGGVAPASACQGAADVGKTMQVPYTATYTFYAEK